MSDEVALITGISGQDGSYLAELLVGKGYTVHGIVRPTTELSRSGIGHLVADGRTAAPPLFLHRADLFDPGAWRDLLHSVQPAEWYHLAGPSRVGSSFEAPESVFGQIATLTLQLFEVAAQARPSLRICHASSAEIFGNAAEVPQSEMTPLLPVSPYGRAKAIATEAAQKYRDDRDLFICNAILYNHESPRRGEYFVTQKIARAAARISVDIDRELVLGNLNSRRDWGHARDYVRAMWLMLQHGRADDYIVATGATHSIREFLDAAFAVVGLSWQEFVRHDASLRRPADPQLVGNAKKIRETLGWQPTVSFAELVREMVEAELEKLKD